MNATGTARAVPCRSCGFDGAFVPRLGAPNRFEPASPLRIVTCPRCGLCGINPQYAFEDYEAFYRRVYFDELGGIPLEALLEPVRKPYHDAFFPFFREFTHGIPATGRYLDAGAGAGLFLEFLEECTASGSLADNVFALEPSSTTNAYLRKRFPRVQRHEALVETNQFRDQYFDAILCSALIEHFIDPLLALLHLNRILRPGGTMMLLTPKLDLRACRRGIGAFFKFVHTFYYTETSLRSLLSKAGFVIEREREYRGHDSVVWYTALLVTVRKVEARHPDNVAEYRRSGPLDPENLQRTDALFRKLSRRQAAKRLQGRARAALASSRRLLGRGHGRIASAVKLRLRERGQLKRYLRIAVGLREFQTRVAAARATERGSAEISDSLRAVGYRLIDSSPELRSNIVRSFRDRLAGCDPTMLPRQGKHFFSSLLEERDLDVNSELLCLALEPSLLASIARYLGCAPFLESIDLLYSHPNAEEPLSGSQLWHRDMTDDALVKLFVYLTDVRDENGPFTLLTRGSSAKIPGNLPHYLDDDTVRRYVPDGEIRRIVGPAGTAFLAETRSCFHRGSRCEEPRLALICYYTSGFGYYPRLRSWTVDPSGLTTMQRLALGLQTR